MHLSSPDAGVEGRVLRRERPEALAEEGAERRREGGREVTPQRGHVQPVRALRDQRRRGEDLGSTPQPSPTPINQQTL